MAALALQPIEFIKRIAAAVGISLRMSSPEFGLRPPDNSYAGIGPRKEAIHRPGWSFIKLLTAAARPRVEGVASLRSLC